MKYEYKDSGIDWIGKVPKHWRKDRLKDISEINYAVLGNNTPNDYTLKYIDISNVDVTGIICEEAIEEIEFELAPSRARRIIRKGDIIVSSVRPNLQAIAFINLKDDNLICSTGFNVIKTNKKVIFSKFLYYFILSEYSKNYFVAAAKGVGYPAISDKDFNTLIVLIPKFEEQIAIANYLDKVCADIDRVVEIKRKQIENLQLMFFAFLDEIFDNFNTNWIEDRIKDISLINPKQPSSLEDNTLVSVVPMEAVSEFGDIDNSITCEYKEVIGGLNFFQNGDMIFAKITPCMENGKGAFVENLNTKYAFGSTEFFVVRPSNKVLGKFIYYFTRTLKFRQEAEANMKGAAGQQRVVPRNFYNAKIQFPKSIKKQNEILEKIEDFKNKNFQSVDVLEKQIEKLVLYKKSLIHEVVTGKKQVYGLS